MTEELTIDQVENASRLDKLREAKHEYLKNKAQQEILKSAGKRSLVVPILTAIGSIATPIAIGVGIGLVVVMIIIVINGQLEKIKNFFTFGDPEPQITCESDPSNCNAAGPGMSRGQSMDNR